MDRAEYRLAAKCLGVNIRDKKLPSEYSRNSHIISTNTCASVVYKEMAAKWWADFLPSGKGKENWFLTDKGILAFHAAHTAAHKNDTERAIDYLTHCVKYAKSKTGAFGVIVHSDSSLTVQIAETKSKTETMITVTPVSADNADAIADFITKKYIND